LAQKEPEVIVQAAFFVTELLAVLVELATSIQLVL
jgi:hypothetical protein